MFTRVFEDDSHATDYFPLQKKKETLQEKASGIQDCRSSIKSYHGFMGQRMTKVLHQYPYVKFHFQTLGKHHASCSYDESGVVSLVCGANKVCGLH